jgi:uncharacterized protein GlcG (DUF336 family)
MAAGTGAAALSAQQASPVATGDVPTRAFLTLETARTAMDAAMSEASSIGVPMHVMIVDDGGTMKAFARQDGAILGSLTVATEKANTAISFGAPTHMMADGVGDDPVALASITTMPGITLIGGGYPIYLDEQLVGAIGVSGGTVEEDQQCAEAALAAIGAV